MENTRAFIRRKRHNRLLVYFFLILFSFEFLNAQSFEYTFEQTGDFAASENCLFTISLVGVSPSNVELIGRTFPPGISFVSSEKSDGFVRQENGINEKATIIRYSLKFEREGLYNLGSLPIMLNDTLQSIAFPVFTVLPNPDVLTPQLFIEDISPLYNLQEGTFTVSAKHFKNITDFSIELSEQALIEQIESYSDIPSKDFTFTNSTIPIAKFSCIPFESGSLVLPTIKASFIAYNGTRHNVTLPYRRFDVLDKVDYISEAYGEERAFLTVNEVENPVTVLDKKETLVRTLVDLRIEEKYSLLPFNARRERTVIEKNENIQNVGEVSYTWTIIGIVASFAVLIIGLFVHLINRKKGSSNFAPLFFFIGSVLLVCILFYGRSLSKDYAITYATNLYTIPEYESQVVTSLYAGMKVEVDKTVGDWCLITHSDGRSGWVLEDHCILITNKE